MKIISLLIVVFQATNVFAQEAFKEPVMILVEKGSFEMGGNTGEKNERPVHEVKLHSYYIGKYEVTQDLWRHVMKTMPATFAGCGECPVEQVNGKQINL
ncbi:MAG: Sulphatase-modifying factor protein, partial [Bacteroidota bacterium]|nr:Sulphatase-modifying factor protein [Bacteroidota bacterium]